jgi:hypothetical protein
MQACHVSNSGNTVTSQADAVNIHAGAITVRTNVVTLKLLPVSNSVSLFIFILHSFLF